MNALELKPLLSFALDAYVKLKNPRTYALGSDSERALAALAAALKQDRASRNLTDNDEPTAQSQMVRLLENLDKAGCNITQRRPEAEEKLLPKPWRHPITNEILPPPTAADERAVLAKTDPALLELLDQLQARPYQTVQKMREAEAKRKELAAVTYNGNTHVANPWRTGYPWRTAERRVEEEIIKSEPPEVVAFYQREAQDVDIPLFGQGRNLTVESRLARDSDTYDLIKLAQKIHGQWRAEDKRAAEEKRAAAEAELKELSAA